MIKSLLSRFLSPVAVSLIVAGLTCACGGNKQATVSLELPDDFNGKTLDLISFNDSTVLGSATIENGTATLSLTESDSLRMPVLAQFVVDGRVKGYYVIEEGEANWTLGERVAKGTDLNVEFSNLIGELDKADEAENFPEIIRIAEKNFNANKDNIFGPYFGVEWLKWADPTKVDSLLNKAPESFRNMKRAQGYINFAHLRAKTSPGQPFADFEGKDADGNPIKFSDYVTPGKYVLIDFMASWCPYCIKDMPKIKEIYGKYKDKGLEVVSVAVRDEPAATAVAVKKHGIDWSVVYDAQKRPYDIYGFSGIPHYMLIGPDGKIVARSMKVEEIEGEIK
ncbi:MAG: TlpA family protein disulfide reductase [Muribaculaceae bacterium]|nr:TlpA family protein disulfide reductase [Muribaculaceae bacterium]